MKLLGLLFACAVGVKRNFATLRELLSELVEVKDNTQAAEDKADTAAAAAAIDGTGVNLGTGAATAGFLSRLAMAESQLLGAALPIAVWLEKHPVAGKAVALCGRDALSASISVAMVLLVLKVFMALKIYVGEPFAEFCTDEGCHPGLGQALCFVYSLGYLLDLPDSIWEVFCSLVLLAGVQWAAASLLTLAPFQASIPAAAPPPPTVAAEDTEPSEAETREGHAEEPLSTKSVVQAEVQKGLATIKTGLMDISSTVIDGVQRSLIRNAVQSSTSVRPPVGSTPIQPTKPILRSAEVTALETGSKDDNDHAAAGEKPQVPPCAELFENERYQPLRGWGHSWPGHFMPGDFRHWSNATDASSMVGIPCPGHPYLLGYSPLCLLYVLYLSTIPVWIFIARRIFSGNADVSPYRASFLTNGFSRPIAEVHDSL